MREGKRRCLIARKNKTDNIQTQDARTSAALIDGAFVVVKVGEHAHSVEVVAGVFDDPLRTVFHQMLKQRQRLPEHVYNRITAIHTNEAAACQIVVICRYLHQNNYHSLTYKWNGYSNPIGLRLAQLDQGRAAR